MSTADQVNERLRQQAQGAGGSSAPATTGGGAKTLQQLLKQQEAQIARCLPKHVTIDRFTRIALTALRTVKNLDQCTPWSFLAAIMQAAQLGLEIGVLGQAYVIPFRNNKRNCYEATFIIGYRGMVTLARNSGEVRDIIVREVYKQDKFRWEPGILQDVLEHTRWDMPGSGYEGPTPDPRNGKDITHLYLIVRYMDGSARLFDPVSKAVIEQHRARSKAANDGPWVSDWLDMAKKTVVRMYWKWLPLSVEQANAVEASDETIKYDLSEDMTGIPAYDVEAEPVEDGAAQGEERTGDQAHGAGTVVVDGKEVNTATGEIVDQGDNPAAAPQGDKAGGGKALKNMSAKEAREEMKRREAQYREE